MVILYKDPEGKKIFERTYSVSQATATNCNVEDLEKHCKDLENRLGKYEVSSTAWLMILVSCFQLGSGCHCSLLMFVIPFLICCYRKLLRIIEVTVSQV